MVLSIIFLEDKHTMLLHLSIFYEYQQFFSKHNLFLDTAASSTRKFTWKSEIFRHKTSHMVLSIILLEDRHKSVLHLSIFYEYQHFFQHRICFSIQAPDYSDPWPTLVSSNAMYRYTSRRGAFQIHLYIFFNISDLIFRTNK
jgi:hypothetical protein